MSSIEIKKGIYWVGSIDWNIRNFHGYLTQNGTTYNAYLIVDEKTVLIDTVKPNMTDQFLARVKQVIDPATIDYVISNHTEMDHSGAIPDIMSYCPDATIISSKAGEKGLKKHFKEDLKIQVVKSGDTLDIGKRTLSFVNTPMVHWPDSMVTYLAEEKILFSNDAFGQHVATSERFDDEIGWSGVCKDAAKYYANIVLPFGNQTKKALSTVNELDIELICPSHGLIWRKHGSKIIDKYAMWANNDTVNKAVIVYDSMWNSTEALAFALERGLNQAGVSCVVRNLRFNHISDIMTDVIEAKMILMGSPTLNNGMLPTMGEFITYLKGLKPKNRLAFAFGSYGWGGQAVKQIVQAMEDLKWEQPLEGINIEYVPDEAELGTVVETGMKLGSIMLEEN